MWARRIGTFMPAMSAADPDRPAQELFEGVVECLPTGGLAKAMMSVVRDAVVVHEPLGRIVAASERAAALLGVRVADLLGATSFEWEPACVRPDGSPFPGTEHPAMVALRTGEPQSGVVMGVERRDGTVCWIEIDAVAIFDGSVSMPCAAVVAFREVTPPS